MADSPSPNRALHIGAGLWALRSTAREPASIPALYMRAIEDARHVESIGFDSFWVAEHRFWYDGWCPQPLMLASALAAATSTVHIGTAMHLLSQHDPERSAVTARTLEIAYPGRIQLGVSLGYRDEEFEGLGLARRNRGQLLEAGLDTIRAEPIHPPIWVGGMAEAAIVRAATRGLSLLLPPTLSMRQVERCIGVARETAGAANAEVPHIGMLKDVWIGDPTDGTNRLRRHYREYVTAWWGRDEHGRADPARIESQVDRNVRAGAVGSVSEVVDSLATLVEAGVDTLVLQIHMESTRDEYRAQLETVAESVLPELRQL